VLRLLKEKYHKASLRTVAPAKIKVSQRKRLPSTILSYTQTKIKAVQPQQQRAPRVPGQRKRLPPMLL